MSVDRIKEKVSILLIFLFYAAKSAYSQDNPLLTIDLQESGIEQLVNEIEHQTSYRFYYDLSHFDSLKFSLKINNKPLHQVLEQTFVKTSYHYAIFDQAIFLTKDKKIITELTNSPVIKGPPTHFIQDSELADLTHTTTAVVATLENKVYTIGGPSSVSNKSSATVAGYVRYAKTGEPATGVSIHADNAKISTTTDQSGYYSLTLPKGKNELNIRAIDIKETRRLLTLNSDGRFDINVTEQVLSLKEVVISGTTTSNVKTVQMGIDKLDIKTIKQVPTVFGEADLLRVVLTLPGVKSVGESSTGFNVRGGSSDQNLILYNDATIYNPSHFFGFFSAISPEVVKDVQLYKSSIPPKFGGRLASVLELTSKEGNKKKITGTAGLGLLTTRLSVEGPLIKDKTSFIVGGRTTYSNWLLRMLPEKSGYKNARANFSDVNLNIGHRQNSKTSFYFTGYQSSDYSNLATDTAYTYNNANLSLKWKQIFNIKLSSATTIGLDEYRYQSYSSVNVDNAYKLNFKIIQANLKTDFNYYVNTKNTLDFGLSTIHYRLKPAELQPFNEKSLVLPNIVDPEQGLETAIYFGNRFELSRMISLNAGIRYSMFNVLGPGSVNIYAGGQPRDEITLLRTVAYNSRDNIKTYGGPEFRIAARFTITSDFAIKASFNTLRQYIHMLSNITSISPTDIWKLSDMNIKPQTGSQVSLGLYKNFKANTIEASMEVYFKNIHDYLDYKSGASLVLNHAIERDVINTDGKAYGIEFLIKKSTGKLNGWLGYTYSRTKLRADLTMDSETINSGNYYPANHDKPHDFTLIANYRFSHRVSLSFNSTYSTGRPITLPIARYVYSNAQRLLYTDRNQYRTQDYYRSDLSLNILGNHKIKQLAHNSWTIGVYNLTGRKNPFANYYVTQNGAIIGYKLSIFGTPIPFVNYNIQF